VSAPQGAWGQAGLDVVEAIERGCSVQTVGFDRAMREIKADPFSLRPTPAPQPADLFKRDLEVPAAGPHPEPLVPYREAKELELPSAARTVRKQAEAAGWRVRATYALGWAIDSKGATKALTHTLALRMERGASIADGGQRLVACWAAKETILAASYVQGDAVAVPTKGWKFDLAYGWSRRSPLHKLSSMAMKSEINEEAPGGLAR
jgi:hypothetical protein